MKYLYLFDTLGFVFIYFETIIAFPVRRNKFVNMGNE